MVEETKETAASEKKQEDFVEVQSPYEVISTEEENLVKAYDNIVAKMR